MTSTLEIVNLNSNDVCIGRREGRKRRAFKRPSIGELSALGDSSSNSSIDEGRESVRPEHDGDSVSRPESSTRTSLFSEGIPYETVVSTDSTILRDEQQQRRRRRHTNNNDKLMEHLKKQSHSCISSETESITVSTHGHPHRSIVVPFSIHSNARDIEMLGNNEEDDEEEETRALMEDDDDDSKSVTEPRQRRLWLWTLLVCMVALPILIVGCILVTRPPNNDEGLVAASSVVEDETMAPTVSPVLTTVEIVTKNLRRDTPPTTTTIGSYLSSTPEYASLYRLLDKSRMAERLHDSDASSTIFVSTDFDQVPERFLDPGWFFHRLDMAQNLIAPGKITWQNVDTFPKIESLAGKEFRINREPPMVNGIVVRKEDAYQGTNGVVHVLQSSIFPSWYSQTFETKLAGGEFYRMLMKVGLDRVLGDGPATLFVPRDLSPLSGIEDPTELRRILARHVLRLNLVLGNDRFRMYFDSVSDERIKIDGTVINGMSAIIQADVLVNNGVVHFVDNVIALEEREWP